MSQQQNTKISTAFLSGSVAGLITDIVLFPIDTIKTRLQSNDGFRKSGGFRGIYRGLSSAAAGSMPAGASFFVAYEASKNILRPKFQSDVPLHMTSACIGETFGCIVRIPFEVVKQKAQAMKNMNSSKALMLTLRSQGIPGLYQGFFSMLFRDIPFTLIQMPLWEYLKSKLVKYNKSEITAFQSGVCGSMAGSIAAALTTPLDVAKTRIILSQNKSQNIFYVLKDVAKKEGFSRIFSGIVPRVVWISIGGFVFLGTYEKVRLFIDNYQGEKNC